MTLFLIIVNQLIKSTVSLFMVLTCNYQNCSLTLEDQVSYMQHEYGIQCCTYNNYSKTFSNAISHEKHRQTAHKKLKVTGIIIIFFQLFQIQIYCFKGKLSISTTRMPNRIKKLSKKGQKMIAGSNRIGKDEDPFELTSNGMWNV
jgi:hypothetical protein